MSKVLFAPMSFNRFDADQTLPARFKRLLEASTLAEIVKKKSVAIKMHVGDNLTYSTIPPVFVRILVDFLHEHEANCFVCDHAIAQRKPWQRGYTESILGCPVLDVCGHLDKYYYTKEAGYKTLREIDVAGYINDADFLVDFSHVKGHGACGYGGACKNIAMGCVTQRTRAQIHGLQGGIAWDEEKCVHCSACINSCNHNANRFKDGNYRVNYHNCTLCQHCVKVCPTSAIKLTRNDFHEFQKGMAVCTKTVLDTFEPKNAYFINVLTAITVLCDCWGLTTPSIVPDIGILASDDIVAVERASLDAVKTENLITAGIPEGMILGESGHLFERIHGKDPFVQVRELEHLGLGTQDYEIETID
ncbi:MAG: DUF362 domain-containing protein [Christensenellales bacterium]